MYERILVPTDGSEGAERAAEHAVELAAAFGADFHALYVVQTDVGPDAGIAGAFDAAEVAGQGAVDDALRRAEAAGLATVEGTVEQGAPHRVINAYVDDHDIDLVVMGTHGRTGLARYLIGSVAEKVVRTADVPVLTVGPSGGAGGED